MEARKETPLEKGRRIQEEMRRKGILVKPEKTQIEPLWMRNYPNLTRAQAMSLFCRECMGYTKHREEGKESQPWVTAGKMAKECTDPECPLFGFRPGARRGLSVKKNNTGRS